MPKDKTPRIVVNLQLYYKYPPSDYRGVVQETWVAGRDEPVALWQLVAYAGRKIIEFTAACMGDQYKRSDFIYNIAKAGEMISRLVNKE